MTNLGQMLSRYPEAGAALRGVVTNGGKFEHAPVSIGWNLRYDPVAAALVASSGVEWTLLPETAMGPAALREEEVQRIREAGTELTELLARTIHLWRTNKPDAAPTPHLSDMNVFLRLMDPEIMDVRPGRATIVIAPDRVSELWVERDVTGPHLLGESISEQAGAEVRELFMERILAPPGE
jgi:inosine-uridine nucleoside N-ribohydrolase